MCEAPAKGHFIATMGLRVCLPAAKKLKGMASTDQVNGDVQPLLIGFKQKQGDTSL